MTTNEALLALLIGLGLMLLMSAVYVARNRGTGITMVGSPSFDSLDRVRLAIGFMFGALVVVVALLFLVGLLPLD